jgi:hypothetical protein
MRFTIFGQTWIFKPDAVARLRYAGADEPEKLKLLVLSQTSYHGIDEGVHRVNLRGVDLQISAQIDRVIVDIPS